MERRYCLMAQLGVRNIAGYNRKIADAKAAGEPIPDPLFVTEPGGLGVDETQAVPHLAHLPDIVDINNKIEDKKIKKGKKKKKQNTRLTQKART